MINFVSACITGTAPLIAVQLLWFNMIMDMLGTLALATEPPSDDMMKRTLVGKGEQFITRAMWRNITGQSIYQLIVLGVLVFDGKQLLKIKGLDASSVLNTFIFNTFVFCQSNTLQSYPAELSLTSLICFTGVVMSTIVALIPERGNSKPLIIGWDTRLFAAVYSGKVCSGVAYYVQGNLLRTELAKSMNNLTTSAMGELHLYEDSDKAGPRSEMGKLHLYEDSEKALLSSSSSNGAAVLRVLHALGALVVILHEKKEPQVLEKDYTEALSQLAGINASLEHLRHWLDCEGLRRLNEALRVPNFQGSPNMAI